VKHSIVAKTITRQVAHLTNYKTMLRIVDDLKYLERLTKLEFWEVLFTHSGKHYVDAKWDLFKSDKLGFIDSCSVDKVKILVDYINNCKGE